MKEIIEIQIGNDGNNAGLDFWRKVKKEYGIDEEGNYTGNNDAQLENIEVYFEELKNHRYRPRVIIIGDESTLYDKLINFDNISKYPNEYINLFRDTNKLTTFIQGANFYKENNIKLFNSIRKIFESLDYPQGFQFIQSQAEGFSSGFGSNLISNIKEQYCSSIFLNFSLFPSFTMNAPNTDIYNIVLSIAHNIENTDLEFCLDYKSIINSIEKNHKIANPSIQAINDILGTAIQLSTYSFRFPKNLNSNIRKMAVNFNLYPRLKFYNLGIVPIKLKLNEMNAVQQKTCTEDQICSQLFSNDCNLTFNNVEKGINLCSSLLFFWNLNYFDIEKSISKFIAENEQRFIKWIPDNVKFDIFNDYQEGQIAINLSNNTYMANLFQPIINEFNNLREKRAYFDLFINEGFEEMILQESQDNVRDLIYEYKQYEDLAEDQESAS